MVFHTCYHILFCYYRLESNAIMKTSLVRALNISMHSGTIYIIFFVVFSMYYFYGDGITLSRVFFVMSIFYSIRLPVLVLFPVAVQVAMECYVSCNRIQVFSHLFLLYICFRANSSYSPYSFSGHFLLIRLLQSFS